MRESLDGGKAWMEGKLGWRESLDEGKLGWRESLDEGRMLRRGWLFLPTEKVVVPQD